MNKAYFLICFGFFISNATHAQLPVAGIILGNQSICPGTCTDYINASANATSYLWYFEAANPSTSTDVNPVNICYNTPGNYDVTLIASNSQGSDTIILNNYMTVYPLPLPMAIEYCGDTLFATQGFVSYQWYMNGFIINGATDYMYIASQSSDYNVVGTDINGCEVEAVIFSGGWGGACNCCTGVNDMALDNSFSIFPNPSNGKFIIKIVSSTGSTSFNIINLLGEIIYSEMFDGRKEYEVDVNLEKGIYYVQVKDAVKMLIID